MKAVLFSHDLTDVLVTTEMGYRLRLPEVMLFDGDDRAQLLTDLIQADVGMNIQPQAWSLVGEGDDTIGVSCVYDIRKTMAMSKLLGEIVPVHEVFDMARKDPDSVAAGVQEAIAAAMRYATDLGDTLTIDMPKPRVRTVMSVTPESAAAAREAIWELLRSKANAANEPSSKRHGNVAMALKA